MAPMVIMGLWAVLASVRGILMLIMSLECVSVSVIISLKVDLEIIKLESVSVNALITLMLMYFQDTVFQFVPMTGLL